MNTKPFGPMSPEAFAAAVAAPFGHAAVMIRKHDPLWGRVTGEKIKWRVKFTRKCIEEGTAYVEAATEQEAEQLADKLKERDIQWDWVDCCDRGQIEDIEPA